MGVEIIRGDAREVLAGLPAASVHCCITSPPYFGLRSYGTAAQVWGGAPDCAHDWRAERYYRVGGNSTSSALAFSAAGPENAQRIKDTRWREDSTCARCGAWRGDLGAEPTPALYMAHLVEVFAQVKRVLRDDGTCWIVIGDSYAGSWGNQGRKPERGTQRPVHGPMLQQCDGRYPSIEHNTGAVPACLKPKDLMLIPHRVAIALRDDGWYLRSAITWCKDNPMPESVTDRPTSATEMIFLLAKQPAYYYDAVAIAERSVSDHGSGNGYKRDHRLTYDGRGQDGQWLPQATRNKRNWWRVNSEPLDAEHYAAFPQALVTPMILAGTSEAGCCPRCLTPWRRVVERGPSSWEERKAAGHPMRYGSDGAGQSQRRGGDFDNRAGGFGTPAVVVSERWQAGCSCQAGPPIPCRVMDIFCGSGTTGLVAKKLGRDFTGIELNESYVRLSEKRIAGVCEPLFSAAVLSDDGAAAR